MYALPGEVVVRRRKSLVLPAALLAAAGLDADALTKLMQEELS